MYYYLLLGITVLPSARYSSRCWECDIELSTQTRLLS